MGIVKAQLMEKLPVFATRCVSCARVLVSMYFYVFEFCNSSL